MSRTPVDLAQQRRHELLSALADHVSARLVATHGMSAETAADVANDLADWIASHYGGQTVYFPKDEGFKLHSRDHHIYEKMKRGNAPEIALELGLSTVQVYVRYRRYLAALRARLQPDLFPVGDAAAAGEQTELSTGSKEPI